MRETKKIADSYKIKERFFQYLGDDESLSGYVKSYKLVLLKYLFELMNNKGAVDFAKIIEEFKNYYVDRKNNGFLADKDVDRVIANIEESSNEDIYKLIIKNPYKYIEAKGFITKVNADNYEQLCLNKELFAALDEKDLDRIREIIDDKLSLYFKKIDVNDAEESKTEWLIPINPFKVYKVEDAFKAYKKLDWQQNTNFAEGDIAYIYETLPVQALKFKCKINKVNMSNKEIDDSKYELGEFEDTGRFYEIELIKELRGDEYKKYNLDKYGFVVPQRPIKVKNVLKKYLHEVEDYNQQAVAKNEINLYSNVITRYKNILLKSKNVIFHGSPGTGKTFLAKQIATEIISDGIIHDYNSLSTEQKEQMEFVQFHPSYDYTDFVEGLRPRLNDDGSMGFELQNGIFKHFCIRAKRNVDNSRKEEDVAKKETIVDATLNDYFLNLDYDNTQFKTVGTGNPFKITSVDDTHIRIDVPKNDIRDKVLLRIDDLKMLLKSERTIEKIKDVVEVLNDSGRTQEHSYYFALYIAIMPYINEALAEQAGKKITVETEKKFVFIIDEINRGEISKILGELFFSIDPDYRGKEGAVSTQYSNLHSTVEDKFYVPENVYIIGTMNDIDRSVDTFDFAMRRRFRFIELKAKDRLEMLDQLGDKKEDAVSKLNKLNDAITSVEGLNDNYQIGPSYFLKLKETNNDYDQLWTDYLEPLLWDYIRGMSGENETMDKFKKAYESTGEEVKNGENTEA